MRLQQLRQQRQLSFHQDHLMQQLLQRLRQRHGHFHLQLKTWIVTDNDPLPLPFPASILLSWLVRSHLFNLVSMRQSSSKNQLIERLRSRIAGIAELMRT